MSAQPQTSSPITLREPSSTTSSAQPPSIEFLTGTWHVTHSTLPMWKNRRNVAITYTPLQEEGSSATAAGLLPKIDDVVAYQGLSSTKISRVHGIDTPVADSNGWAWKWRGTGLLTIATSRWEILGYGVEPSSAEENAWAVTYFAKTLFTPAGIDIYSRQASGLGAETVAQIKHALAVVADDGVKALAGSLFDVKIDAAQA